MTEQNYRIRIKLGEIEIEAEGDKEFVERHIEEFKKEMPKIANELPSKEKTVIPETQKEKVESERLSLAEFYGKKNPKTDVEVALTVACYLSFHDKKNEFTNKEIKEEAEKIGYKITNIAHTLKEAAKGKKAYLVRSGKKGSWQITGEGKRFVEKELPRKSEE